MTDSITTVTRIHTEHGSHIEPPLDRAWSEFDKLRWQAAVVEHDHDLRLDVREHAPHNGRRFTVSATSPRFRFGSNWFTFQEAWGHINDLALGAQIYRAQHP